MTTYVHYHSQVSDLGNTGADLTQWCREQIVLRLAPGEYDEGDIAFNLKRAHIALRGHGVSLLGNVDLAVELADVPPSRNLLNLFGSLLATRN